MTSYDVPPARPGQPDGPRRDVPQPAAPGPGADRWLELEQVVDRLARLVLNASALAERWASSSGAQVPARDERIRRLQAGADLARRALVAAVRVDQDAPRTPWSGVERRRSERRRASD